MVRVFYTLHTNAAYLNIPTDTISTTLRAQGAGADYTFSEKGIAWPGEKKKYTNKPDYNDYSQDIVPPPNWMERYPNGYNSSNIPQLRDDEHFQNWMRTAGLPTFTKLYGRNDNDKLTKGTYEITIDLRTSFLPHFHWVARLLYSKIIL
jgi:hypothetical protein